MDVIGVERDRDDSGLRTRRRPATSRGLPVTAAVALAAALVGVVVGRAGGGGWPFGGGTTDALTGTMVLELQEGSYVEEQSVTDQMEFRGEDWQGTFTVESDPGRAGTARLQGSASYVGSDTGPVVAHTWGTAEVTFDGRSCTGTYAYSAYRSSDEGDGSIHLRCDEGSVLGATMSADGTEPPTDDGTRGWRITIALTDGYLLEG